MFFFKKKAPVDDSQKYELVCYKDNRWSVRLKTDGCCISMFGNYWWDGARHIDDWAKGTKEQAIRIYDTLTDKGRVVPR